MKTIEALRKRQIEDLSEASWRELLLSCNPWLHTVSMNAGGSPMKMDLRPPGREPDRRS